MPILMSLAAALAGAGIPGSMLAHRRIKTWREARSVKGTLMPYLDRLIYQAETRDPPFDSLGIHGSAEDDGAVRSRSCFIHFEDCTHVHVSMRRPLWRRKSDTWLYAIDFKHPALDDGRFPGYGRACRSPWFVERMEKLFRLLDAYPPEDLAAARRDREHEARLAEWDALDKETEELLAADAESDKEDA